MKLNKNSIEWALIHTNTMKDTDLFPKPKEIEILNEDLIAATKMISEIDLSNYQWKSARRFIIPKKELSYRLATQLNPIDSILFAAIVHQFGEGIEERRIPIDEDKIFSHRFSPNNLGYLYTLEDSWRNFWYSCEAKINQYNYAVYLDISDFYNQIYHHTVENELIGSGFPNVIKKSLINLFSSITAKNSRGIPIGPHCSHLIAEMTLIPLDNFINIKYDDFCRYADDIVIFCNDLNTAQRIVYELAEFLDSQQRLVLNSGKTKIYSRDSFTKLCENMTQDNPINDLEQDMVNTLNRYGTSLYTLCQVIDLEDSDLETFSQEKIKACLDAYLDSDDPNFDRIKWLYRRLAQIRVDTAVIYTISNLYRLTPAITEIINYLTSIGESPKRRLDLNSIGDSIFELYYDPLVQCNPYLQISLISLFSESNNYNHLTKLIDMFKSSSDDIKREILLACYRAEAKNELYGWIYGLKEQAVNFSEWTRRAYYITCSFMHSENRDFFFKNIKTDDILERYLIKWSKRS